MCNALLNTASLNLKRAFVNNGELITWKFVQDIFKVDCQHSSPITSLTKAAVFPDGWSKMNVSATNAPFSFDTITAMMVEITKDLDCAEDMFIKDTSESDIPKIYKNLLELLMTYQQAWGDTVTASKLRMVEYCVHVAIIFNKTLLNRKVNITAKNIAEHEKNLRESLKYFEDWGKVVLVTV